MKGIRMNKLEQISSLMSKILLAPTGEDGHYKPIKGTTRIECMDTLGKIQEILRTNNIGYQVIQNKPNEVKEVIHYVPNRKLIGIVDDFGSPLGMQYEWYGENWQKVANLGHDIESIKRKYGG